MPYKSQGTLRAKFKLTNGVSETTLHFFPTRDYSFKHDNENRAIFVSPDGLISEPVDQNDGVKIQVEENRRDITILGAVVACQNKKVKIEVDANFKLTGIEEADR